MRQKSAEEKRQWEKQIVSRMIAIYCKKNHRGEAYPKNEAGLCSECAELEAYAGMRSDKCPFMETKTFCSNCKVHCYQPAMREKIRQVMRFSGPRMLFYDPVNAIRHVVSSRREKKQSVRNKLPVEGEKV